MTTRTVRLDEEVLKMAEIQAIRESSLILKQVSIKDVIRAAVEKYVAEFDFKKA